MLRPCSLFLYFQLHRLGVYRGGLVVHPAAVFIAVHLLCRLEGQHGLCGVFHLRPLLRARLLEVPLVFQRVARGLYPEGDLFPGLYRYALGLGGDLRGDHADDLRVGAHIEAVVVPADVDPVADDPAVFIPLALSVRLDQIRAAADIQLLDFVPIAGQRRQLLVMADIQGGKAAVIAHQRRQRRVLADVQRIQRVSVAGQIRQRLVAAEVQDRDLVFRTAQLPQRRVLAHVQLPDLIVCAVKLLQLGVFSDVQHLKAAAVAVERGQLREILYPLQTADVHALDADILYCRQLLGAQLVCGRCGVKLSYIRLEHGIGEGRIVDWDIPRRVGRDRQQGKRHEHGEQRAYRSLFHKEPSFTGRARRRPAPFSPGRRFLPAGSLTKQK